MDEQTRILSEILKAQQQQNLLLEKHLLRLKYSLRGLLLMMTLLCGIMGAGVYWSTRPKFLPATAITVQPQPTLFVAPPIPGPDGGTKQPQFAFPAPPPVPVAD